jgi:type III secretory pathway component EscU
VHLELTCPGCGHRVYLALSESGKSHACPSCETTCVVPQLGHPISEFTLSDKAKAFQTSNAVTSQSSHLFLRTLSALFIALATLKLALAVWTGAAYYSTASSASRFNHQHALALNNAFQNFSQHSHSEFESALGFVSILSAIECLAFFRIARYLRRMTHYRTCFLIAVLACLTIPFGMALGVATIVVLMDQEISRTFFQDLPKTAS